MGCDFYIYKYLEIEHKNGVSYYSLKDERGWFCELDISWNNSDYESDGNDDFDYSKRYMGKETAKLWDDMVKLCLTPREPMVLFENGKFMSKNMEKKYTQVLQDRINNKFECNPMNKY